MNVLLVVEVIGLKDKVIFEKHLKKEGFTPIEEEELAYHGETTTHLFSTRAYILEVVTKGLKKSGFDTCKIIFQVGENPMESYCFNLQSGEFEVAEL